MHVMSLFKKFIKKTAIYYSLVIGHYSSNSYKSHGSGPISIKTRLVNKEMIIVGIRLMCGADPKCLRTHSWDLELHLHINIVYFQVLTPLRELTYALTSRTLQKTSIASRTLPNSNSNSTCSLLFIRLSPKRICRILLLNIKCLWEYFSQTLQVFIHCLIRHISRLVCIL